ncbi:gamma-glutamyltransferase [Nesterenkonia ebinurensis]|uniref:gamma-glutamyltransferase n=1 Tax=Nesterenkonia ebinurensis TaxID=2608252 RepID=UPI00123D88B9|nr:gamma-glutamyltransferase [Nesterenkonia ebinurensis]
MESTSSVRTAAHPAIRPLAALGITALLLSACGTADPEAPEPDATEEIPGQQLEEHEVPEATGPAENVPEEDEDEETEQDLEPYGYLDQQAVSAGNELAVDAAEETFEAGGNAVDAAVAASFAIATVEPVASGIGGGGSVILAGPEGEPVFYDYREVVNNDGQIPETDIGIPGFVAGMGQLHQDYGELDWEQVLAPSIELAEEGFEVTEYHAERINTGSGPEYLAENEAYSPDGAPLQAGDTLIQPELAETMLRLADAGWEDLYTGELADSLAAQVKGVDTESLADYEVITAEPVTGEVGDYQVVSAAPALPGAALIQMLQVAEAQGAAEAEPGSAAYIDAMSQAWAVGEGTIRTDLGDPNFVDVPVEELTDPEANAQIEVDAQGGVVPRTPDEEGNTTHLVVVDENGLMVSMTNTVTDFWGSGVAVDGYFMNNALYRFQDIDSPANQPEPGRRSVTWSNPTMVLDDQGRPVLGIGTPGGIQIVPTTGHVLAQWIFSGKDLQAAVEAPRFRGDADTMRLEMGQPAEVIAELEEMGWSYEESEPGQWGSIQSLEIDYETGEIIGADDPRRDGAHRIID